MARQHIIDLAVTTAKIADLAVTTAKIGVLAVTSATIADASITTAKINDLAVTTAKINDLSVTTAKIAALAVTNAQINDLDAGKITAGLLTVGRLNVLTIIMQGFSWTDNTPGAGSVTWSAGTLMYGGVSYAITGNNTALKYIYWQKGTLNTTFQASNTRPTLGDDDFLIATNVSGAHDLAWNAIGNSGVNPLHLNFESMASLFIYGDGIDGIVTISANTTLTRDMAYDTLTINVGVVLTPAGYRIYVKNTLTNNGTIRANGGNGFNGGAIVPGQGGQGGAASPAGTMGGGGFGGGGATSGISASGGPAGAGGGLANALGGVGGAGGVGGTPGPYANGAGGAKTQTVANRHGLVLLSTSPEVRGGTGGGGGGAPIDQGSPTGGGGGGGAGPIIIAARTITNNGTMEANGGNGGNNGGNPGGGGGGGGGGGAIVLVYRTITLGTTSVAAGTFGTGFNNGVAGTAGIVLQIQQEA
jgi:hypothetical protein